MSLSDIEEDRTMEERISPYQLEYNDSSNMSCPKWQRGWEESDLEWQLESEDSSNMSHPERREGKSVSKEDREISKYE